MSTSGFELIMMSFFFHSVFYSSPFSLLGVFLRYSNRLNTLQLNRPHQPKTLFSSAMIFLLNFFVAFSLASFLLLLFISFCMQIERVALLTPAFSEVPICTNWFEIIPAVSSLAFFITPRSPNSDQLLTQWLLNPFNT